jgi:hypothetical protein
MTWPRKRRHTGYSAAYRKAAYRKVAKAAEGDQWKWPT